jgi:hypothetical protein
MFHIQTLFIDAPMMLNKPPRELLECTMLILNCRESIMFTKEPEYENIVAYRKKKDQNHIPNR